MLTKLRMLTITLAVAAPCWTATAQDTDQRRFQAFLVSDFGKSLTSRALATIPQSVFQRCPALASSASRVVVLKPISFAASGFPNAGAWKQELPIRGCGDDVTLNVYYAATPDEKVQTFVGAPGATRADMTLQRDAFTYAAAGLRVQAPACGSYNTNRL